jgi:hypothetical protein
MRKGALSALQWGDIDKEYFSDMPPPLPDGCRVMR